MVESVIRPFRGKEEPLVPEDVVMVMLPHELKHLAAKMGARPVAFRDGPMYRLYLTDKGRHGACALAGPFLGAPHAVLGLEKLIALGARRIWAFGWCGSLSPKVRVGDFLLPTGAFPEEGTSGHYPLDGRRLAPDAGMVRRLSRALESAGVPFETGPVWTTDAVYRETPRKIKAHQEKGALAVEMEMSALMAVSLYRGVGMCGFLVVSDELFELKWRPGFDSPVLKERSRSAGEFLLDLVRETWEKEGRGQNPGL